MSTWASSPDKALSCAVCGNCACNGCRDSEGNCATGNKGSVRWKQYFEEKRWQVHRCIPYLRKDALEQMLDEAAEAKRRIDSGQIDWAVGWD